MLGGGKMAAEWVTKQDYVKSESEEKVLYYQLLRGAGIDCNGGGNNPLFSFERGALSFIPTKDDIIHVMSY